MPGIDTATLQRLDAAHHLHPFTAGERLAGGAQKLAEPDDVVAALGSAESSRQAEEALSDVERFSGFPEPLFAGRIERLRKWRRVHADLVIRQQGTELMRQALPELKATWQHRLAEFY